MNIEIKTTSDSLMLVNWNNVNCVKETKSHFGDPYREIYFNNGSEISTNETVEDIKAKLNGEH
jgi:hypothetical protein